MPKVERALISLSDKRGAADFAKGLADLGVQIISTGGTARALRDAGLRVTEVAEITGSPEMLDGRVKTLHPRIHGALLGRRDDARHVQELADHGIVPLDLVAVNLYPFEATTARDGVTWPEALEQIDIGGPALIRSAAKNFASVGVVVDPADYPAVLDELRGGGALSEATRWALARRAFAYTARYDALIADYLRTQGPGSGAPDGGGFPPTLTVPLEKIQDLRYGENPHQRAAFYRDPRSRPPGVATARQLQGKELSYNNVLDLDAGWRLVGEFGEVAAVIIKHTNPCGAAIHADQAEAYRRARATDPDSAYGGVLAFNRPLGDGTAREIAATFVEAIIAPGYEPTALAILKGKKNLRLLDVPPPAGGPPGPAPWTLRSVGGGALVQEPDTADPNPAALRVVTHRAPTPAEMEALRFAWRVVKHVKSNAIVFATAGATVGIGAGQMSRVDAVRIARIKAQMPTRGSVVASDAFFPFRDGVDAAAEAGATAIIHPGGSVRDAEVIRAADEHGIAMVLTGLRHFRH